MPLGHAGRCLLNFRRLPIIGMISGYIARIISAERLNDMFSNNRLDG